MIKEIATGLIFCLGVISGSAQKKPITVTKPNPVKKMTTDELRSSLKRGKALYATYCLSCHQADGGGVPNLNPPLSGTPYVLGNKEALAGIVLNGFEERVDIADESYSNNMPPLKILKDQQIADILTYVRNAFGNKASAVTSSDVRRARNTLPK